MTPPSSLYTQPLPLTLPLTPPTFGWTDQLWFFIHSATPNERWFDLWWGPYFVFGEAIAITFFLYHLLDNRLYFFLYFPPKLIGLYSLLLIPYHGYELLLPLLWLLSLLLYLFEVMIGTCYLCCFFLADPLYGYDEFGDLQLSELWGDPFPLAVGSSLLYNFCKVGLLFNFFLPTIPPTPHVLGRVVRWDRSRRLYPIDDPWLEYDHALTFSEAFALHFLSTQYPHLCSGDMEDDNTELPPYEWTDWYEWHMVKREARPYFRSHGRRLKYSWLWSQHVIAGFKERNHPEPDWYTYLMEKDWAEFWGRYYRTPVANLNRQLEFLFGQMYDFYARNFRWIYRQYFLNYSPRLARYTRLEYHPSPRKLFLARLGLATIKPEDFFSPHLQPDWLSKPAPWYFKYLPKFDPDLERKQIERLALERQDLRILQEYPDDPYGQYHPLPPYVRPAWLDDFVPDTDLRYGLLFLLALSSLTVYSIILAGWSSNSKYAFLGALRSAAQMISYEVAISLVLLPIVLCAGSLGLTEIVFAQFTTTNYLLPLLPAALVFIVSMLAETNRTPFDLPEAEAELVAGYNVDYSSLPFAMFFLGEYANMILMSTLFCLLFLGGGELSFLYFLAPLLLALKASLPWLFFILVRATLPRYRYDQLMDIGWKAFLPITSGFLLLLIGGLLAFDLPPSLGELPISLLSLPLLPGLTGVAAVNHPSPMEGAFEEPQLLVDYERYAAASQLSAQLQALPTWLLVTSFCFLAGLLGMIYNYKNFLITIMCVEVMYLGAVTTFVLYGLALQNSSATIFGLLTLIFGACESAVGLGLLVAVYRFERRIDFKRFTTLGG